MEAFKINVRIESHIHRCFWWWVKKNWKIRSWINQKWNMCSFGLCLRQEIQLKRLETSGSSCLQMGYRSKVHGIIFFSTCRIFLGKSNSLESLEVSSDATGQHHESIWRVQLQNAYTSLCWWSIRWEIWWITSRSLRVWLVDCHRNCLVLQGWIKIWTKSVSQIPNHGTTNGGRAIEIAIVRRIVEKLVHGSIPIVSWILPVIWVW